MDDINRNYYLEDIPMEEALEKLRSALVNVGKSGPLEQEDVSLEDALRRITARPIWALRSSPHYNASAMDGYAVDSKTTKNATETRPIRLLLNKEAIPVNTGAPIPTGMNAVIMVEHVQHIGDEIEIIQSVPPWQHVRMMGEDIVATELLLPSGHQIRPVDLGAIAGCGHDKVAVCRRPHVVLIPTGNEMVKPGEEPAPGQIIEYNSLVLSGQLKEQGALVQVTDIVPDDKESLVSTIRSVLESDPDLILVLSGSSAGTKDFTANVLSQLGDVLVHGVAVRPGHPVIMAMVSEVPVIGVPGYPVSAALTFEIFISPLIRMWLGLDPSAEARSTVMAKMTRKLMSPIGDDDFVRVTLAQVGDELLATPLGKGAGVITSLVRADGIAHVPRFNEGIEVGNEVKVTLYRSLEEVRRGVFICGSHDPMLDLLGQYLLNEFASRLTSANVGSIGGLIALKRWQAHCAGIHLLDPETGEYNLRYVAQYLGDQPVELITFAEREQGLIVAKGNPLNIQSIDDLVRVRYVNRQRGAGTRVLLDFELAKHGIPAEQIDGYEREEYTHLAVASAVFSGISDCGMGVRSAALSLDLDFIPVGWERFDIVIPEESMSHAGVKKLIEILQNPDFKLALSKQPGYRTNKTGNIFLPH